MKIIDYSFGRITINGKTYTSDVIIYPDRVDPSWWRLEGHLLQVPDLKDIVAAKPQVLIIGTGAYGSMRVPEKTLEYLGSNAIETRVSGTKNAVELFSKISSEQPTITALHLTC